MPPIRPKVLVIDDDRSILDLAERALSHLGFGVALASSGHEGLAKYGAEGADLVLVDLKMPDMTGIDVIQKLKDLDEDVAAIIITGYGSIDTTVEAMRAGALDYVLKPLDLDHLEIVLNRVVSSRRQAQKLQVLEDQLLQQGSFQGLVGVSSEMQAAYALIRRLARSDTTVLIQGETGTGKELVAQAIHTLSDAEAFVPINCGALSESILESELFGHEEGAFTGAVRRKYGLIEQAEGGTLFLDEIEEMSPAVQVKLLRAVQEREVLRVGGTERVPVKFRLLAATNANLRERMEAGAFREDLFYRLSVLVLDLPPLRDRLGDVPLLVRHFAAGFAYRADRPVPEFTPEAMMLLCAYAWPGNVRELENAVVQALTLCEDKTLDIAHLPPHILGAGAQQEDIGLYDLPFREAREAFEKRYLEEMLQRGQGRVAEAARQADLNRQYFYEKMKRYGIPRS